MLAPVRSEHRGWLKGIAGRHSKSEQHFLWWYQELELGNASELNEQPQQKWSVFLLCVKHSSFVGKIKPEKSKNSLTSYTLEIWQDER